MKTADFLGIEQKTASHAERFISLSGAFIGIFLIFYIGRGNPEAVIASMGATSVLLFAVPHSPLSQPWHLFAGHLVSALIGVSCAKLIPEVGIAAPIAVALAIAAMHYLRCIHPPGGATAFVAVAGGAKIHALGYGFLLSPILSNVTVIFLAAFCFNWFFSWRRYPAAMTPKDAKLPATYDAISHEDFVYALSQIDSFIDVSEQDLLRIYHLATKRHESLAQSLQNSCIGRFYSNGEEGAGWQVRKIVDLSEPETLIYKVVAGEDRHAYGVMHVSEFSAWAKSEVERVEEEWRRIYNRSAENAV